MSENEKSNNTILSNRHGLEGGDKDYPDNNDADKKYDEKNKLIDDILEYYKDGQYDIDELRDELKWQSVRELKKALFDTKYIFNFNNKKKDRTIKKIPSPEIQEMINKMVHVV